MICTPKVRHIWRCIFYVEERTNLQKILVRIQNICYNGYAKKSFRLDEADSLCGKRSEINDSKDKYANNDTAFVLQRIESFDGIVILATNYINNIDSAFMRRMKYVIQFSVPDAKIRYQIWKSSFTEKVAVSNDVDFQYLAEQFEFSGSNIKNIVLASVFLSASENTPVNMKHILISVYNEYLKQQRHMFAVEFGKYEELYNQIIK